MRHMKIFISVSLAVAVYVAAYQFLTYLHEAMTFDPTLMYAPTSWCEEHHPEWTLEQCADAAGY